MRYLKIFEKHQLESKLAKCHINNYVINDDNTISVHGNVSFKKPGSPLLKFKKLPFKFKSVTGDFDCSSLGLKTLEGCPSDVGGTFNCGFNNLTTLLHGPTNVGKHYNANGNNLKDVRGLPNEVYGNLFLSYNNLDDLDDLSSEIEGFLSLSNNMLIEPDIKSNIGGGLYLDGCATLSLDYISTYYKEIDLWESALDYYLSQNMPKDLYTYFQQGITGGDSSRRKVHTEFARIWSNHIPVSDKEDDGVLNEKKMDAIYGELRAYLDEIKKETS